MKFIHYLEKISGVDWYGLSSLLFFVAFFIIVLIMVYRMKPATIDKLKNIPLNS